MRRRRSQQAKGIGENISGRRKMRNPGFAKNLGREREIS